MQNFKQISDLNFNYNILTKYIISAYHLNNSIYFFNFRLNKSLSILFVQTNNKLCPYQLNSKFDKTENLFKSLITI